MHRLAVVVVALAAAVVGTAPTPTTSEEDPPRFSASISWLDKEMRELMIGRSWRRGCPVPLRDLREVRLRHWGFDRQAHWGRLVLHRAWAPEIVDAFERMYRARFPIRKVRLVDRYGADDLKSMKDDNTSAFNCRWRAGQPGVWSEHAYGRAIDVNPRENPYVVGDHVSPPAGRRYLDRSLRLKGMIHADDAARRAFTSIGWEWGGAWKRVKDYQHFSSTGR
jgi:hypothetical protein